MIWNSFHEVKREEQRRIERPEQRNIIRTLFDIIHVINSPGPKMTESSSRPAPAPGKISKLHPTLEARNGAESSSHLASPSSASPGGPFRNENKKANTKAKRKTRTICRLMRNKDDFFLFATAEDNGMPLLKERCFAKMQQTDSGICLSHDKQHIRQPTDAGCVCPPHQTWDIKEESNTLPNSKNWRCSIRGRYRINIWSPGFDITVFAR